MTLFASLEYFVRLGYHRFRSNLVEFRKKDLPQSQRVIEDDNGLRMDFSRSSQSIFSENAFATEARSRRVQKPIKNGLVSFQLSCHVVFFVSLWLILVRRIKMIQHQVNDHAGD